MTDDNLRDRVPDTVPDDIELFERDGEVHGRDSNGEFALNPMAGTEEPQEGRCGVPLKSYMDRYGEIRYCGALPVGKFKNTSYDHDEFCRNHQLRNALMERAKELFEHGYFASNYANFVDKIDPVKFLFAVQMVGGLFEQSQYEFDVHKEERNIDTSESEMIEEDQVRVTLPIPQNDAVLFAANELWMASIKEVMSQNMSEVVFEEGMSKQTYADSADMEGQITDYLTEDVEHHLHLPISRLAKDIKEHLQNGGVSTDGEDAGSITFEQKDYTLAVEPDPDSSGEATGDAQTDFHDQLTEGAEIEVDE